MCQERDRVPAKKKKYQLYMYIYISMNMASLTFCFSPVFIPSPASDIKGEILLLLNWRPVDSPKLCQETDSLSVTIGNLFGGIVWGISGPPMHQHLYLTYSTIIQYHSLAKDDVLLLYLSRISWDGTTLRSLSNTWISVYIESDNYNNRCIFGPPSSHSMTSPRVRIRIKGPRYCLHLIQRGE